MVSRKLKFVELRTRYDMAAHITRLLRQFQAAEAKTKEGLGEGQTRFQQEVGPRSSRFARPESCS